MEERFIRVPRTARYHVLGDPSEAERLWIVLHGYGQLARYFLNKFEGLEKGLLIVAPEGLSRFYLDPEHQRVGATWMTREDREHEITDQIEYLDTLTRTVRSQVDPNTRIGVLGFSQGVATACRWSLLGATIFDQLMLWGGSLPAEMDRTRIKEKLMDTRVKIIHGSKDRLVPRTIAEHSLELFKAAGANVTLHEFNGGHELDTVLLKRNLSP